MKFVYETVDYEISDELSFKDFTGRSFVEGKPSFDGQVIYATCFCQETPDAQVFPEGLKGAIFIKCNLTNVLIPDGNTVIDCNLLRYAVQNDMQDWRVDEKNNPIEPIDADILRKFKKEVPTPDSLPENFIRRERVLQCDYLADRETEEFKSWFLEEPKITTSSTQKLNKPVSKQEWESMQREQDFYPFDKEPSAFWDGRVGWFYLSGESTYVTIEGPGLFKGGIGARPFIT